MNTTELKPCPFCGGKAEYDFEPDATPPYGHMHVCDRCATSSGSSPSREAAIAAWNRRAPIAPTADAQPIITFDDGARVILDAWTGGRHEAGSFGELTLRFVGARVIYTAPPDASGQNYLRDMGRTIEQVCGRPEDVSGQKLTDDRIEAKDEYVRVPLKPTAEIVKAGGQARIDDFNRNGTTLTVKDANRVAEAMYNAMIYAAIATSEPKKGE